MSYATVLALVALSFVVQAAAPDTDLVRIVVIWLQAATLVVSVRVAHASRRIARLAAGTAGVIALAAPLLWALNGSVPDRTTATVTALLVGVAPMVIAAGLVRDLRETRVVTMQTLSGVLSVYLLAGMFFSFVYAAIEAISEEPFFVEVSRASRSDFLYYSYTTMTTTGFGDFTAATDVGRTLSVTEALTGQIYLVTVVALIVSNLTPRRR